MFTALWNWWNPLAAEAASTAPADATIDSNKSGAVVKVALPKHLAPFPGADAGDNICIFGPAQSGKTTLINRLAKGKDVHVIDQRPSGELTFDKPVYWTTTGPSVVLGTMPRWVCIARCSVHRPLLRRQLAPELDSEQFTELLQMSGKNYGFVVFDTHSSAPIAERVTVTSASA